MVAPREIGSGEPIRTQLSQREVVVIIDSRDVRTPLTEGSVPAVVPAGPVTVLLDDDLADPPLLDGHPLSMTRIGGVRISMVDLTRSTGFHCLRLSENRAYWFASEDGKLQLDGVFQMLEFLEVEGLSWGSQLFFADGQSLTTPQAVARWAESDGPVLASALEDIADRPIMEQNIYTAQTAVTRPPLDLAKSMALFRRQPNLLEPSAIGTIEVDGTCYSPREVVKKRRGEESNSVPNRRAKLAGELALRLIDQHQSHVPAPFGVRLNALRWRIHNALTAPFFQQVTQADLVSESPPESDELSDPRYEITHRSALQLLQFGGSKFSSLQDGNEVYVRYADQVYQAFVACVLANALGLVNQFRDLQPHRRTASFASADLQLWYDSECSPLTSWRENSSKPDLPRPDLVLRRRVEEKFCLIDCKYRLAANKIPESAIAEVQYYMQTYGLNSASIVFPGNLSEVQKIQGKGNTLLLIPLRPDSSLSNFVQTAILPALQSTYCAQKWLRQSGSSC